MPRIALGGLLACTNTFVRQRRTADELRDAVRLGAAAIGSDTVGGSLRACADAIAAQGWEVVSLPLILAGISGRFTAEARQWTLAQFRHALEGSGPVDGVFLQLHGTCCADDDEDVDGTLVAMLREVIGPAAPIVCALDGHANISARLQKSATALLTMKTNPHVDYVAVGARAGELIVGQLEGRIAIHSAWAHAGLMASLQKLRTAPGTPMDEVAALAREAEASDPRILDVSVAMGLFASERADTGMSVTVTTDGAAELGEAIARQIAAASYARRGAFEADLQPVAEGVHAAIVAPSGPVILGDVADSIFSGAPGDGTAVLAELLRQDARNAVVVIWDPSGVKAAIAAGEGGAFAKAVGGKADAAHGPPILIDGVVRSLHPDGRYASQPRPFVVRSDRGPCAVVECRGVEIVLTSRAIAAFEPNYFLSLGIDPAKRKIIVCKAEMQHRPGFEDTAAAIIDLDGPGLTAQNMSRLPYSRVRRPIWPLDRDALG